MTDWSDSLDKTNYTDTIVVKYGFDAEIPDNFPALKGQVSDAYQTALKQVSQSGGIGRVKPLDSMQVRRVNENLLDLSDPFVLERKVVVSGNSKNNAKTIQRIIEDKMQEVEGFDSDYLNVTLQPIERGSQIDK